MARCKARYFADDDGDGINEAMNDVEFADAELEPSGNERDNKQHTGVFGPPVLDKDGKPVCFGQFISGRRCDCEWQTACVFYTYDERGTKSRQARWTHYETMPIIDDMDWPDESGEPTVMQSFKLPDGRTVEASSINLPIIQVCVWMAIENPAAMRALMIKMDPDVKSLQDIADILKISKQAVQKRVAGELGIGKRQFKESTLLQLNHVEMQVYKLCVLGGMTTRKAADNIGNSAQNVQAILRKLRRMGVVSKKKTTPAGG